MSLIPQLKFKENKRSLLYKNIQRKIVRKQKIVKVMRTEYFVYRTEFWWEGVFLGPDGEKWWWVGVGMIYEWKWWTLKTPESQWKKFKRRKIKRKKEDRKENQNSKTGIQILNLDLFKCWEIQPQHQAHILEYTTFSVQLRAEGEKNRNSSAWTLLITQLWWDTT